MTRLADLGQRVCILGPSNSGKSTLAAAIGAALEVPAIHLDQLHHLPDTDWTPRPWPEFLVLHDKAILGERWVMDGNYSRLFPKRFLRATGVILLDVRPRSACCATSAAPCSRGTAGPAGWRGRGTA